jgi:hypothetical protein
LRSTALTKPAAERFRASLTSSTASFTIAGLGTFPRNWIWKMPMRKIVRISGSKYLSGFLERRSI